MRKLLAILTFVSFVIAGSAARAAVIVNFSPNATGAALAYSNITDSVGQSQVIAGQFTLDEAAFITGGSIFSNASIGSVVGTPVRFLIYSNPSVAPIVDITTSVDLIDTTDATFLSTLNRKHASIAQTYLAAGTYWFAMPAANNANFVQGTGYFGDSSFRQGFTPSSLTTTTTYMGKPFFQLEGSTVPEPGTVGLIAFAACAIALRGRRRLS